MSEFKPWVAETVVGSNRVFTSSIPTWMSLTLINIHAHSLVLGHLKAVVADALVTSLQVNT